jgi:hypothetical protein
MSQSEISEDILEDKYKLIVRYPDGHKDRFPRINLMRIRHMNIRKPQHGTRPVFLQVIPKVDAKLWDYLQLHMKLHPIQAEEAKNGPF